MSDVFDDTMTATVPRRGRRLSDRILTAFHQACDQEDFEVADALLDVVGQMIAAPHLPRAARGSNRRRDQETLVAAYERLWQFRNPDLEERRTAAPKTDHRPASSKPA